AAAEAEDRIGFTQLEGSREPVGSHREGADPCVLSQFFPPPLAKSRTSSTHTTVTSCVPCSDPRRTLRILRGTVMSTFPVFLHRRFLRLTICMEAHVARRGVPLLLVLHSTATPRRTSLLARTSAPLCDAPSQ
ncbi:ubiquitin hydrolase, partial [Trypanosoma cruzi]